MRGTLSWYGTEGFRVRLIGGRGPLRRFVSCVLLWKNASRFLSSAPLRIRIPPLAHKKNLPIGYAFGRFVSLAGTEGFEPPTAGTKNRSSTVELRPNVGVA